MKKIISILLLSIVAWPLAWAQDNTLYNVMCQQSDNGNVIAIPNQGHHLDTITLKAMPNEGYELYRYTIVRASDHSFVSVYLNGTFVMPPSDVVVSADFRPKRYSIYLDQCNYGYLSTFPSGSALPGDTVEVTFSLNAGVTDYNITDVTVDKVYGSGFSDDDPWGPAYAPSSNDNSVDVTQNDFYTFSFVMPSSDVQVAPIIDQMHRVTLRELAASGEEGKLYIIRDIDLAVGHYDQTTGIIYAKDNNHADAQEQPESSIDYVTQLGLQPAEWDHSNWLAIDLFAKDDPDMPNYEKGKVVRRIRGKLVDATNLQMMVAENPFIPKDGGTSELTMEYTTNNFIPANYHGTQEGTDGNTYFFIAPAANEYSYIHKAVWDESNEMFIMPLDLEHGVNTMELQGSFPITLASDFDTSVLIDGAVYRIEGISKIMKNEEPSGIPSRIASDEHYSVYVINATKTADDVIPKIRGDVNGDGIVNGADVTALYNLLLDGIEVAGDPDVNADGFVNGSDVTALYNLLLGN